jgi:hypothetical protein
LNDYEVVLLNFGFALMHLIALNLMNLYTLNVVNTGRTDFSIASNQLIQQSVSLLIWIVNVSAVSLGRLLTSRSKEIARSELGKKAKRITAASSSDIVKVGLLEELMSGGGDYEALSKKEKLQKWDEFFDSLRRKMQVKEKTVERSIEVEIAALETEILDCFMQLSSFLRLAGPMRSTFQMLTQDPQSLTMYDARNFMSNSGNNVPLNPRTTTNAQLTQTGTEERESDASSVAASVTQLNLTGKVTFQGP